MDTNTEIDNVTEWDDDRDVPAPSVHTAAAQAVIDQEGELTDDQILAVLDERDGLLGRTPSREPGRPAPWRPSGYNLQALSRRPDAPGQTPAEDEAWEAVKVAHDALTDAQTAVAALPGDQAREQRELDREAADALRAGKAMPKTASTNFEVEGRRRRAVVEIAIDKLREARRAFDKVSASEAPKRKVLAVERMTAARAKAHELMPAALEAFEAYRAAMGELEAVVVAERPDVAEFVGASAQTDEVRALLRSLHGAAGAIRSAISSEEPLLTGAYLLDPGEVGSIPPHARRAIAQNGREALLARLAMVEVAEDFTVTSYAQRYAWARGMVPPPRRRPMGA